MQTRSYIHPYQLWQAVASSFHRATGRIAGLVILVLLFTGCHRRPTISAQPNPVPGGPAQGTTTITWDTGDGSEGEIYLFVKGQEQLFAKGSKASKQAPWISAGPIYEFRLYAPGKTSLLSSVKVTRNKL